MHYIDLNSNNIDTIKNIDAINESIQNIVLTKKGSVPGLPDFGSFVHDYLFEQLTPVTVFNIQEDIIDEIEKWEPRVKNLRVNVSRDKKYENTINITIGYEIVNSIDGKIYKIDLNLG